MTSVEAKRSVGRPREFNEEAALEAAMDIFWQKGFEATSMADLCSCTGLHKGSLYQAFGDKHQIFLRALKHYADREFKEIAAVVYQFDSPLESIRAIVRELSNRAEEGRGCLIINSLVELAPHDPEVRKMILDEGKRRVRVMGELLVKAQECGEIRTELDPSILARQLMISLAGSAALVKGFVTTDEVLQLVNNMIDLWT